MVEKVLGRHGLDEVKTQGAMEANFFTIMAVGGYVNTANTILREFKPKFWRWRKRG